MAFWKKNQVLEESNIDALLPSNQNGMFCTETGWIHMHWNTTENNHLLAFWIASRSDGNTFMCKSLYSICIVDEQCTNGTRNSSTKAFVQLQFCAVCVEVDLRFSYNNVHCCCCIVYKYGERIHEHIDDSSIHILISFIILAKLETISLTKQAENGAVSKLNNHSDLHTLKSS